MSDKTIQKPSRNDLAVYVGNLDSEVTKEHLSEKFGEIGEVTRLVVTYLTYYVPQLT